MCCFLACAGRVRVVVWRAVIAFALLWLAVLPSQAQDLSRFSGIWVVDMKPTLDVWQKNGHPLGKATQNLLSAYRIRVDFTKQLLEEGIVVGDDVRQSRFEVSGPEKDRFILTVKDRAARAFSWQVVDDDRVIVAVKGKKEPPLCMVREKLVRFSGIWQLEDPKRTGDILKAAGLEGGAVSPESLADLRVRVDFDAQNLEWVSRTALPELEWPQGDFVVTGRMNDHFTLSFSKGALLWHDGGKNRAVITVRDVRFVFVRQ